MLYVNFMVENLPGEAEENVYILGDKIVITVLYTEVSSKRILPYEWIITFDRKEVRDVEYDGNLLILSTKEGRKIKLNPHGAKELYSKIRMWLKSL